MARRIKVASGQRGVSLDDGLVLKGGDTAVVSDDQFTRLSALIAEGTLVDLGTTTDPVTSGSDQRYTLDEIRSIIANELANPESASAQALSTAIGAGVAPVSASVANVDPLRYDSTRLRAFRAALGLRATAPVDILCIGDSVTEGMGATTPNTRWIARLRDMLRTKYQPAGVVGGEGYVPGFYVVGNLTKRFASSGSPAYREDLGGLGIRTMLNGGGAYSTFVFTGTGLDFLYSKGSTGGLGSWAIDGGAATQFQTNAATTSGGNVLSIRGLTAAQHTLVISHVSGGNGIYHEGAMVYNGDESLGIRLWDSGHSGFQTDDFKVNAIDWRQSITPVQPDLVTIFLGLNDYGSQSQTRLTPAQVTSNLQRNIADVRAKCTVPPSILLVIPYERSVTGTLQAPWSDYRAAIEGVASTDGQIGLLDLGNVIGSFASGDPYDMDNADGLHPNDRGHQVIADAVYRVLVETP